MSYVVCIFFFKQKTAYEMRISDWSSDVCSSDLIYRDPALSGVIATAMVVNNLVAGLSGILVPLTLDRMKVDPAVSSAVFVTMMTDIMGFFSFLGLATLAGLSG